MNLSESVAYNVQRLRKARGFTTRGLEKRLTDLGHRIASSSITNMEQGRREASLEDIAALALALEVAPLLLIAPIASSPTVSFLGSEVSSWQFAQWFAGRAPFDGDADSDGDYGSFIRGTLPIRLRINHDVAVESCKRAYDDVEMWERGIRPPLDADEPDPAPGEIRDRILQAIVTPAPVPAELRQQVRRAESQLRRTRSHMKQQGIDVPELPEWLRHVEDRTMDLREPDESFYYRQASTLEQSS